MLDDLFDLLHKVLEDDVRYQEDLENGESGLPYKEEDLKEDEDL